MKQIKISSISSTNFLEKVFYLWRICDKINGMKIVQKYEKHFTASVFIFHRFDNVWKVVLVHHRKFERWMIPGGHVECMENPVEAVLREAKEETGLVPRLFSFMHRACDETESQWILPPEYFFEQKIPQHGNDNAHYHVDCIYVSFVDAVDLSHNRRESHGIRWFSEKEIREDTTVFSSTQKMALTFFEKLKNKKVEDIATYIHNKKVCQ